MSITVNEALDRLRGVLTSIDEEALDVVFERWEEALPVLLREIESAEVVSRGDKLYDISLFHAAIVLCAEKRESRAFAAIQKRVVTLQYDSFPFGFQRFRLSAAWAACCDRADQLLAVFDDEVLYPKAREEAFHALLFLHEEGRWSEGEFTSWLSDLIEFRLTTLPPELASVIILVAAGMLPEAPKVLTDRLVEYSNQVNSGLSKSLESILAPEQGNFFRGVVDDRYWKVDSASAELDFLIDVNTPEDETDELLAVMDDPDYLLTILDGKREMELVEAKQILREGIALKPHESMQKVLESLEN